MNQVEMILNMLKSAVASLTVDQKKTIRSMLYMQPKTKGFSRKKQFYEKRVGKPASLSLKKTFSISIDYELDLIKSEEKLGGYTELNKLFLQERFDMTEKEFEDDIVNYITKKANIKDRKYSEEFRLFLANKVLKKTEKKEIKERMNQYVKNKEFK